MSSVALEVCVDSLQSLKAAFSGGASRVELCSILEAGGLTPSGGLMQEAASHGGAVYVMIRPRAGDFVFSQDEIDVMRRDVDLVRDMGLPGVVLGVSAADGRLNVKALEILCKQAEGLGKTLHRAIDVTPDPFEALEVAVSLGFERILTSGQKKKAVEGVELIAQLVERAKGRISIMPGSGVNKNNVKEILAACKTLSEIHTSCSVPCPMASEKARELGFDPLPRTGTNREVVAELVRILQN